MGPCDVQTSSGAQERGNSVIVDWFGGGAWAQVWWFDFSS